MGPSPPQPLGQLAARAAPWILGLIALRALARFIHDRIDPPKPRKKRSSSSKGKRQAPSAQTDPVSGTPVIPGARHPSALDRQPPFLATGADAPPVARSSPSPSPSPTAPTSHGDARPRPASLLSPAARAGPAQADPSFVTARESSPLSPDRSPSSRTPASRPTPAAPLQAIASFRSRRLGVSASQQRDPEEESEASQDAESPGEQDSSPPARPGLLRLRSLKGAPSGEAPPRPAPAASVGPVSQGTKEAALRSLSFRRRGSQIYHEDHAVIPNSSLTEDALGDPFEKDDHDLTAPSPYLASTSPNAIATAGIDTDNAEIGATTSAAGGSAGAAEPVRVTETDRLKALKSLSQKRLGVSASIKRPSSGGDLSSPTHLDTRVPSLPSLAEGDAEGAAPLPKPVLGRRESFKDTAAKLRLLQADGQ